MTNEKKGPCAAAWMLFNQRFKHGDAVIAILEDERICWGRLELSSYRDEREYGCSIQPTSFGLGGEADIPWMSIVFICHDGFPVRKLMGADGSALIEQHFPTEQDELQVIREALAAEWTKTCIEIERKKVLLASGDDDGGSSPRSVGHSRIGFGDPFLIENVSTTLYNPGNDGPAFWDETYQEVLCMESRDGAQGMLWEMNHLFHVHIPQWLLWDLV